jgi:outer membrane protein assembly factor BamD (BamD/ComL family)
MVCIVSPMGAQEKADAGPTNEKAKKTYKEGLTYLNSGATQLALDDFVKADKQDAGHCLLCQKQMVVSGMQLHNWKVAEAAAEEMIAEAQHPRDVALAHYEFGAVLTNEAWRRTKMGCSPMPTRK